MTAARRGLRDTAEYPSKRDTCRMRELRRYRRDPGEGRADPEEGRRGRSQEIEEDRRRSKEIERILPNFAGPRSTSLAARILDPNLADMKRLN